MVALKRAWAAFHVAVPVLVVARFVGWLHPLLFWVVLLSAGGVLALAHWPATGWDTGRSQPSVEPLQREPDDPAVLYGTTDRDAATGSSPVPGDNRTSREHANLEA